MSKEKQDLVVKVVLNDKVYQMSEKLVNAMVDLAKQSMKGKHAILATNYAGVYEFTKQEFANTDEMLKVVSDYEDEGIKVFHT